MLFKLTNTNAGRSTHCGVLEFVADEGKVFIPHWVCGTHTVSILTRPRNKSGRYTGHHDRCIINFAGQDGCLAGHVLIFLFAPILSELVQV
jgi:hypothetical protein